MRQKGYVSPVFLIAAAVFLTVLIASVLGHVRTLSFFPRAVEPVKEKTVELLPSEKLKITCGNGAMLNFEKPNQSNLKVVCGVLPSN